MKLFTCTDRAISLDAMKNKLFLASNGFEKYGRTRYVGVELDITATGVLHKKSGKEFTIDDLKDMSFGILDLMLKPEMTFEASVFFKPISIGDLQGKVDVLQKLKAAQDFEFQDLPKSTRTWFAVAEQDELLFAEHDHRKAMSVFANLELRADKDAKSAADKASRTNQSNS